MRLQPYILLAVTFLAVSVRSESNPDPDLGAEHRSAKPEPFLEKLASALGFGSSSNTEKNYRPPQKKPVNRPKPVYKRPPVKQQTSPSIQKPVVAASRPSGSYGAPQAPPLGSNRPQQSRPRPPIAPAASNSFPQYFGGGGSQGKKEGTLRKVCTNAVSSRGKNRNFGAICCLSSTIWPFTKLIRNQATSCFCERIICFLRNCSTQTFAHGRATRTCESNLFIDKRTEERVSMFTPR